MYLQMEATRATSGRSFMTVQLLARSHSTWMLSGAGEPPYIVTGQIAHH